MTWNDSLKIGVPQIDQQHKELCGRIDDLMDACKNGGGRAEILKTMDFLEEYTKKHFRDEEVLHRSSGYPKCAEHKRIHDAFILEVQKLKKELADSGASVVAVGKVNKLVIDWLFQHIKKVDQELEPYINGAK